MSSITREEMIELLQILADLPSPETKQGRGVRKRAEEAIASLQAAEPAAWLFPDMTWTPSSAMGRDHKGKEVFALPCPPAKAQVPDEAFNIIEGIRAEITWGGWRSAYSRDWVMYRISELLSILTASPHPAETEEKSR